MVHKGVHLEVVLKVPVLKDRHFADQGMERQLQGLVVISVLHGRVSPVSHQQLHQLRGQCCSCPVQCGAALTIHPVHFYGRAFPQQALCKLHQVLELHTLTDPVVLHVRVVIDVSVSCRQQMQQCARQLGWAWCSHGVSPLCYEGLCKLKVAANHRSCQGSQLEIWRVSVGVDAPLQHEVHHIGVILLNSSDKPAGDHPAVAHRDLDRPQPLDLRQHTQGQGGHQQNPVKVL
mmetsp:Transcript_12556/g.27085  ORF Transcript_12556/g.27085 Transcript_12556/m.27085 type:complete len:232 (-) Transcript_12556:1231-1926(-)